METILNFFSLRLIFENAGILIAIGLVLLLELIFVGWRNSTAFFMSRPRRNEIWDLISFAIFFFGWRRIAAEAIFFGLIAMMQAFSWEHSISLFEGWPQGARYLCAFLVFDLLQYFSHRIKHEFEWVWYSHRFHHSSSRINAFTALRSHVIDRLVQIALVYGPLQFLFGLDLDSLLLTSVAASFFGVLVHSRIDTDLGWLGRWVLISPRHHHLHHTSGGSKHRNYGTIFIWWDKMFGTYEPPAATINGMEQGIVNNDYLGPTPIRAYLKDIFYFYWKPLSFLYWRRQPGLARK